MLCLAVVVAMLLHSIAAIAQYDARTTRLLDQAFDLEDEEKYVEAAKIYQSLADEGNDVAQLHIAEYYLKGKGVVKNEKIGFKYAKLAADQGQEHAIGIVLFHHAGNSQAYFTCAKNFAQKYPEKSVYGDNRKFPLIFNYDNTIVEYAKCYLYGFGTKKDEDIGWQLIEKCDHYDIARVKEYVKYWSDKRRQAGMRDSVTYANDLFEKKDYKTLARYAHFLYQQAGGVMNNDSPYGKDAFGCAVIAWAQEWKLQNGLFKDDEFNMAEQDKEDTRDLIRVWTSSDEYHQGGKIPMGKYLHDLYSK